MKLKLADISGLYSNLQALDGFQKTETIDGKKTIVFERHSYGSKFTWNRVKNLRILRDQLKDLEDARIAIAKKYLDRPGDENVSPAKEGAYRKEYVAVLETIEDVRGLLKFSAKDLNLFDPKENPEGNRIAATILDGLEPLLDP